MTSDDVTKPEANTDTGWEFLTFEECCARALLHDPRLDEAWDLTEAARDLSRPPGPQNSEPIRVCGDQLSWPFWQGRQWAVTSYGVECRDGTYCVEKDRLWENDEDHSWVHHMAEKGWVRPARLRGGVAHRPPTFCRTPEARVLGPRRSAMSFTDAGSATRLSTSTTSNARRSPRAAIAGVLVLCAL